MTAIDNLVTTNWLAAHIDDPDIVVLDCTNFASESANGPGYETISGRENWALGHIPGSNHADFTTGLASNDLQYRNDLPPPDQFAKTMARLGVADGRRVVLYDTASSMWAARVWWMLRWIGFDNVAILDGGLQGWKEAKKPLSQELCNYKTAHLSISIRPESFIEKNAVVKAIEDNSTCIIDALSDHQFNGTCTELGLSGHITNAINIPATSLIDPATAKYLCIEDLAQRFLINQSPRTIVYCGSGIAAASNAFVLTLLGFKNVSIYMPGLQEWITNENLPMENRP